MGSSSGPERTDRLRSYRLFGLDLASDFPFRHFLGNGEGKAGLTFTLSAAPIAPGPWRDEPLFRSPRRLPDGESVSRLYRSGGWDVLGFPRCGDFYLGPDRIVGCPSHPRNDDLLEVRFLGPVLSYWLELQGMPALHASAVAVDGRAVAFLSRHGGGKTGLAAALMQAGHPLLSDDVVPVEEIDGVFHARPGYPQMRMWPDEAAHFVDRWEELPPVLSGLAKRRARVDAFLDARLPLAALYVAERREAGPVEILDISPRDAVIELVRHSFSPHLVEAAGLQPGRFDLFARLARSLPVRRLLYPSGFDRLPLVVASIIKSL